MTEFWLGLSVPSINLADLLGNFVYPHEFKSSWFVIRDWWISIRFVCFPFQGSLLCDRPVSGNNGLVKFASQIFPIFHILSLARIKQRLPPSLDKKSTHHCDFFCYSWQSRVILSQAGRARNIVISINPAFTKMIDGTEKPKIPSKFAMWAARYNEFRCKLYTCTSGKIFGVNLGENYHLKTRFASAI